MRDEVQSADFTLHFVLFTSHSTRSKAHPVTPHPPPTTRRPPPGHPRTPVTPSPCRPVIATRRAWRQNDLLPRHRVPVVAHGHWNRNGPDLNMPAQDHPVEGPDVPGGLTCREGARLGGLHGRGSWRHIRATPRLPVCNPGNPNPVPTAIRPTPVLTPGRYSFAAILRSFSGHGCIPPIRRIPASGT